MTKRTLLITFLMLCAAAVVAAPALWKSFTDAARVSRVAQNIADFTLPDGFVTDYAVEMIGYSVAAYKSGERGHLVLMQAPPGTPMDEGLMQGYVANDQRDADWSDTSVLATESRTVRGQAATVTTSVRTNYEGLRYRQLNVVFAGKHGTAMLVINQPESRWNSGAIDAFIASIH